VKKQATRWLAVLAMMLGMLIVSPNAAHADNPDNWIWDCNIWSATTFYYTDQEGGYWFTNGRTILGSPSSYCNDINVTYNPNNPSGAFTVRVRFYYSNGTNAANSWKTACSICWALAATSVLNGTHYRLETKNWETFTVYD
jgi:hypothetical protein